MTSRYQQPSSLNTDRSLRHMAARTGTCTSRRGFLRLSTRFSTVPIIECSAAAILEAYGIRVLLCVPFHWTKSLRQCSVASAYICTSSPFMTIALSHGLAPPFVSAPPSTWSACCTKVTLGLLFYLHEDKVYPAHPPQPNVVTNNMWSIDVHHGIR